MQAATHAGRHNTGMVLFHPDCHRRLRIGTESADPGQHMPSGRSRAHSTTLRAAHYGIGLGSGPSSHAHIVAITAGRE